MGVDFEYGESTTYAANWYLRFFRIFNEKYKGSQVEIISGIRIDTYQLSNANWRDNMSLKKQINFLFTRPKELLLMGASSGPGELVFLINFINESEILL